MDSLKLVSPLRRDRRSLVLALLVAVGLAYDAYVHLDLASSYDAVKATVSQGQLFRAEAAFALLAALLVLASDSRIAWLFAGSIGLGGVVAVVLLRYVEVPAFGPFPSMYEPVWFAEKTYSAIAEAAVVVLWLTREALRRGRPVSAG